MFITKDDALAYGYDAMVVPTLNECLTMIANSDLSVTVPVKHYFRGVIHLCELLPPTISDFIKSKKFVYEHHAVYYEAVADEVEADEEQTYSWKEVGNPYEFTLDKEITSVKYADTPVEGATFFVKGYIDGKITVKVSEPGPYTFICDSIFPTIEENAPEDVFNEADDVDDMERIPESIATIAVLYVASELMFDTDQIRAQMLKNDFELALARLDTDRQEKEESFTINSHW